MKTTAFMAILAFLFLNLGILASSNQHTGTPSFVEDSPQVCQFSLSRYTGTVDTNGMTEYFTIGLSCPQESDIYATVVVFIDDLHVASEVVKIPAKAIRSSSVNIRAGKTYKGRSYRLVVQ